MIVGLLSEIQLCTVVFSSVVLYNPLRKQCICTMSILSLYTHTISQMFV